MTLDNQQKKKKKSVFISNLDKEWKDVLRTNLGNLDKTAHPTTWQLRS